MAHRFTDEQLSLMKEKYPGDSAIVIAGELGVSPQTVRRRLRAMGVPIKASGSSRIYKEECEEWLTYLLL